MRQRPNTIGGEALMFSSVIFFTAMQSLSKFLGTSVSSWTKTFWRCVFTLLLVVVWMAIRKERIRFVNLPLLLLRGITGAIAVTFYFWTIDLLDLLYGTLYLYVHPVFAVLFAALLFGESLRRTTMLFLVLAIVGLVLVVSPGMRSFGWGDLVGIAAAVAGGLARSCVRELGKTDTPGNIVIIFMGAAIVLTSVGISVSPAQTWQVPLNGSYSTEVVWYSLAGIGLSSAIALLLMTLSFRKVSTAVGSIIAMSVLPVTALVSVFVFGEQLSVGKVLGGILILASGIGVAATSPKPGDVTPRRV